MAKRPVVFLDRDGTLNHEIGYIHNVEDLVLLPGAAQAVARLNRAGVACIVVSNQSGPARGFYPESHVEELNARLILLLEAGGASLDAVYYCPHHADGVVPQYTMACDCRKPAVGMIERAFAEHPEIDRGRAYMVGDQGTDMHLARNAGLTPVLVKTGFAGRTYGKPDEERVIPAFTAESVVDAVDFILKDLGLG